MSGNKERIARLIENLRKRTVAQGYSREEAMAAVNKISELCYAYGYEVTEKEIAEDAIIEEKIDLGQKTRHPVLLCIDKIAKLTFTKGWYTSGYGTPVTAVFFGQALDCAIAKYDFEICLRAINSEQDAFRRDPIYRTAPNKRAAMIQFSEAMARAINDTIRIMIEARTVGDPVTSDGRSLVVVKGALVEAAYKERGYKEPETVRRRAVAADEAAAEKGRIAGSRVTFNPGIAHAPQKRIR